MKMRSFFHARKKQRSSFYVRTMVHLNYKQPLLMVALKIEHVPFFPFTHL